MRPIIINGKDIATKAIMNLKQLMYNNSNVMTRFPGLSVIVVGNRKDSESYVRMKQQSAYDLGIVFNLIRFNDTVVKEEEIISCIDRLNEDKTVDGIIVQLPLPIGIDKKKILNRIDPKKDVDGFHAKTMGELALEGYDPVLKPCTPMGVMYILDEMKIDLAGKHVVVLGKSNIVGLPMALMLIKRNATVTVCNSETKDEDKICRTADILITAVGKAKLVKRDWVKEGVIIIDVGINSVKDDTRESGYRLVGDVDYEGVLDKCSMITPVPGGVGPMTVAMLMQNVVMSCLNNKV